MPLLISSFCANVVCLFAQSYYQIYANRLAFSRICANVISPSSAQSDQRFLANLPVCYCPRLSLGSSGVLEIDLCHPSTRLVAVLGVVFGEDGSKKLLYRSIYHLLIKLCAPPISIFCLLIRFTASTFSWSFLPSPKFRIDFNCRTSSYLSVPRINPISLLSHTTHVSYRL